MDKLAKHQDLSLENIQKISYFPQNDQYYQLNQCFRLWGLYYRFLIIMTGNFYHLIETRYFSKEAASTVVEVKI